MAEKKNDALALDTTVAPRGELASARDADERAESKSSRKAGDAQTPGPTELQAVRRSTGKPRETLSHRDKYDFVEVDMKRDFTFDNVVYHSGKGVEIPDQLAGALGLTGKRTSTKTTRQEEIDAGFDKVEKHPTAVGDQKVGAFNAIPVSDPTHELPGEEEREAAMEAAGISQEQHEQRAKDEAKAEASAAKKTSTTSTSKEK